MKVVNTCVIVNVVYTITNLFHSKTYIYFILRKRSLICYFCLMALAVHSKIEYLTR